MPIPMMKAQGVLSSTREWRALLTPEEWKTVYAALPEASRGVVDKPPLPIEWVKYEIATVWSAVITQAIGVERSIALHEQVGRQMIKNDMNTVYRALMRMMTVEYVVKKAASVYSQYARDAGNVQVTLLAPKHLRAAYRGLPDINSEYVAFTVGVNKGVLDLAGVKNPGCIERRLLPPDGFDLDLQWD
jgi:hypothetical protein